MKEYFCRKTDCKLNIDGDINKPEWESAEEIKLVETVSGYASRLDTTVKLMWNDDYLYAAFHCQDDYICATMTEYNDRLYEEDVVELFIDDNKDLKTYIEIEVNPLNALLHYCIHNDCKDKILTFARLEKKVISAVKFEDGKRAFNVEIAIPFTEFVTAGNTPPQLNDIWFFNAYRIDRTEGGQVEYSAWSPTGVGNFHKPEKFGMLVFS